MISVVRQQHEVEKLREEVKSSRIQRDSLMDQLSANGNVLCDLERSVSSLYARVYHVWPHRGYLLVIGGDLGVALAPASHFGVLTSIK